jgi:hypothetical protein
MSNVVTRQRYFYLKTCWERESVKSGERKSQKDRKIRVRVLGGQNLQGQPLDVTLNVSCSHSIREEHPIGTIFGCPEMTERESKNGKRFYKVPDNELTVVEENGKICDDNSRMADDYEKFMPWMRNEERKLKLDWILNDDDLPLWEE